ncbi:MAG: PHP domain-containing protein [Treponema sp.]|jgi:predicted metal-dependent phosphoesterase TrpH|nr:PHP domain-containing protein [Treponema sp.]
MLFTALRHSLKSLTGKADLHIHSDWSDGSLSIPAIVKTAKILGLAAVSITDHDTTAGWDEAGAEGERQGLKIIPGIEVSAFDPGTGRKVHILGYGMKDRETVETACRPCLEDRRRANWEALFLIQAAGYPLDEEDLLSCLGKSGVPYRQHIMHALADRGYAGAIYGPLYGKLFGPGGAAVVKSRYMPAEEAVRLITDCGGEAALAHPFQYDSMGLLPRLTACGLSGIECWHHTQTPEREAMVREAAEQYGLFLTGGSDFHGLYSEKPVPLGTHFLRLPVSEFSEKPGPCLSTLNGNHAFLL